jgi:hypothetical protein
VACCDVAARGSGARSAGRGVLVVVVHKAGRSSWAVRYENDAGGCGEVGGFSSAASARAAAEQFLTWRGGTVAGGRWCCGVRGSDSGAELTMARWALVWLESLDVAPTTMAQCRSLITRHIVPRYGSLRLEEISGLDARMWALGLRDRYADATVATIMKLLSMVLAVSALMKFPWSEGLSLT